MVDVLRRFESKKHQARRRFMSSISHILVRALVRAIGPHVSDELHAKLLYWRTFHRSLNLGDPQSFNEKVQWLKLYDRRPYYPLLADKLAAREYVAARVGNQYLNEMLAVYDTVECVRFDELPDEFVMKATHGSGWNIICLDKSRLDENVARAQIGKWLRSSYFRLGREWAYKSVPARVICERLLRDEAGRIPYDYKLFCFNGQPKLVQVDVDRFGEHSRAFYTTEWNRVPGELLYPGPKGEVTRPPGLDEMISVAKALSGGIPFCRIDLFSLPKVVFGEVTFYPGNGFEQFRPDELDLYFGSLLSLPSRS